MLETNETHASTNSNDRILAALAHGSVVLSFFGPLIPSLLWAFQRRKSAYVAFHAMQAAGYQMLTFWVGMTLYLIFILLGFWLLIPFSAVLVEENSSSPLVWMSLIRGTLFTTVFGFIGIYSFIGLIGAIWCLLDKDFQYPLLGKRLAVYLGRGSNPTDALDEAKEDQWMAAMGHGSAILFIWGLFTPLALFLTHKESPRLRFQCLQAMVYQLIATIVYFGFSFCIMAIFLGMMVSTAGIQNLSDGVSPLFGIALIVFLIIFLLFGTVILLGLPTYHLFAMIAGIQVVKGKEYHYPLLGKILARRLNRI